MDQKNKSDEFARNTIERLNEFDEEQAKAFMLATVLSLKSFDGIMSPDLMLEWMDGASAELVELKKKFEPKSNILQPEKPKLIL